MERHLSGTEIRSVGNKLSGIAARYGVLSHMLPGGPRGSFRERIAPGAFNRVLRSNPDVVCLFNHDVNKVLGRTSSGTLQLRSTDRGLEFDCELPNTSYAKDVRESVMRGDIGGCSFAFNLGNGEDESWDYEESDDDEFRGTLAVRTLNNFKQLFDVSPVTTPAYPGTSLAAREKFVAPETRARFEAFVGGNDTEYHPSRRALMQATILLVDQATREAVSEITRKTRRNARLNQVL